MEDGKQKRNLIILALTVTALVAVVGYQWRSSSSSTIVPVTRTVRDFIVTWQCLNCEHQHDDRAGSGPLPCPQCNKDELYATIKWACPQHGAKVVFMQYNEQGKPSEYRFKSGQWAPAIGPQGGWNIRCPNCRSVMMPAESPKPAEP